MHTAATSIKTSKGPPVFAPNAREGMEPRVERSPPKVDGAQPVESSPFLTSAPEWQWSPPYEAAIFSSLR
jgi:hypothetical protein